MFCESIDWIYVSHEAFKIIFTGAVTFIAIILGGSVIQRKVETTLAKKRSSLADGREITKELASKIKIYLKKISELIDTPRIKQGEFNGYGKFLGLLGVYSNDIVGEEGIKSTYELHRKKLNDVTAINLAFRFYIHKTALDWARKLSDFLSNHYVILDEKIDFLGEKFINDVILETRKFYFNIPDFLINNSEEKFLQSLEEF